MSDYLDRFEHPLAADLVSYDIINVKFPWQTSKPTLDCGVFAMVHMLNYDGEIFESQLDNAKIRRTMRAEICVALILCDINNIRKEIIQKIHEFNEIKASIRDKLWMIYKEQDNIRKELARLKELADADAAEIKAKMAEEMSSDSDSDSDDEEEDAGSTEPPPPEQPAAEQPAAGPST
ncbi:hypothetical protein BVRB_5g108740 [Beta vulgaris subsp. vulgaris]|nr:hypothetical protein BVRB_5g108740 [Beta vulgaris subsp. vulgaris]